ncbi:hypothetical protein F383_30371 [Gossypium arboreum]|uniref:Uncharacterized protein n=1 Tax=Gossypium arboreum TaxID=29729 RepID=A0A0B0PKT5_GOSAR|nr:hypothetical protein F383_30371 [Gossypium arboreum]
MNFANNPRACSLTPKSIKQNNIKHRSKLS